jgi:hypothetical protein
VAHLRAVVAVALLTLFAGAASASAAVEQPPEYLSSFGPDGSEASGFEQARAIAIDEAEELIYVIDQQESSIFKFDLEGQPASFGGSAPYISGNRISGLSFPGGFSDTQVAVDPNSHDFYVTSGNAVTAFHSDGEQAKFTKGPGTGTNAIGGFGALKGVAVDTQGNIYASDTFDDMVKIFAPTGAPITQFSSRFPTNLAVDAKGKVYVTFWLGNPLGTVRRYTPSEFPVSEATTYAEASAPLTIERSLALAVDATSNDVYVPYDTTEPKVVQYDENGNVVSSFAGPGEEGELTSSEGVAVHGGKGLIFVSDQPSVGLSQVKIFKIFRYAGPPRIDAMFTSGVAADSAVLHAELNPGSAETTYSFEYGLADCATSACASVPLGGGSIEDGYKVVKVSRPIAGLEADTTYHYRLVAENEHGPQVGEAAGDHTFRTQVDDLGFELADGRAWEIVSPPDKHGARFGGEALAQASAAGDAIAYMTKGSIEADPDGNRLLEYSSVFSRRGGAGWSSKDITSPNAEVTGLPPAGTGFEFQAYSSSLDKALMQSQSGTLLSAEASGPTPYLRENTEPGSYRPLVTAKEGFANVPPGTDLGEGQGEFRIAAANAALSHVALLSTVPLAEGDPPAVGGEYVYLWSGGQIAPVSVLPAGEGGATVLGMAGSDAGSVRHAVSEDGSRVFWGTGTYGATGSLPTALYVRDMQVGESARLDVPKGGSGAGAAAPVFQGASADAGAVFFTDTRRLTPGASPSGPDLYRCELPAGSVATGCATLTDISAPIGGSGESAEVEDLVSGMSEDGSSVYFVARGVLDEAANEVGDTAVAGQPNLYLWRQGAGVRFLASLSERDAPAWGKQGGSIQISSGISLYLSAASSPDGRHLAFMSERPLTGQTSRDAISGEPVEQVFTYDALGDRLSCASCNPTGASPRAERLEIKPGQTLTATPRPLVDPRQLWKGRWAAATLPQHMDELTLEGASLYTPRFALDNGRVFFNAIDSLVPADSNGEWDVYQYEPIGVGDCSASSGDADTSRSAGGCVSLVSSGTAEGEAGFRDASESGGDIFIVTPAQLNETDQDRELDVYDARVGGVPATLPDFGECLGEACQPGAVAPNDPTPASAAFKGQGNLKPGASRRCAKGKRLVRRKGRARCVVSKRPSKGRAGKPGRARR